MPIPSSSVSSAIPMLRPPHLVTDRSSLPGIVKIVSKPADFGGLVRVVMTSFGLVSLGGDYRATRPLSACWSVSVLVHDFRLC